MSKSERQKFHQDALQDLPLQEASESITEVNSSDYERELSEEQLESLAGGYAMVDASLGGVLCFNYKCE